MAELSYWFHPAASSELFNIYDHYFAVAPELAEDFESELKRAREVITRSPNTWPKYIHGTQRYLMQRFPYFVVYRVGDNRIEIIAIAHERQRPGYWAKRKAPE